MHKYFMMAALEQAWLGRGICAPNPSVGAVAVHQGKIIARAYHKGVGTTHAEPQVLQQLPPGLQDVSLYITLEPCNHWGRTPPCVDAIIQYGIARVIYGFQDPNPVVVKNDSSKIMKKSGIPFLHYPLKEVDAFYQSYNYWNHKGKPWVTAKIAQSLDAKIAGPDGKPCALSNSACAEFTHQQRLHCDAILTTARTISVDNPKLNARVGGSEQSKIIVILDSHLSLTGDEQVFSKATHCIVYYNAKHKMKKKIPNSSYFPIAEKDGLLNLVAVIDHLGSLGFHDLWVEAGGLLFSALHRERLVNRSYIYIVPKTLGANAIPSFCGETIFTEKPTISWQIKADNVIACLDWEEA